MGIAHPRTERTSPERTANGRPYKAAFRPLDRFYPNRGETHRGRPTSVREASFLEGTWPYSTQKTAATEWVAAV